ncbi:hypothetical protein YC2023_038013 [Brassica napus]
MTDEKILWADPDDDSRFAAAISDHKYALDPTNPWFKSSKAKRGSNEPRTSESKGDKVKRRVVTRDDGMLATRKRSFTESATVKSLRLKLQ